MSNQLKNNRIFKGKNFSYFKKEKKMHKEDSNSRTSFFQTILDCFHRIYQDFNPLSIKKLFLYIIYFFKSISWENS